MIEIILLGAECWDSFLPVMQMSENVRSSAFDLRRFRSIIKSVGALCDINLMSSVSKDWLDGRYCNHMNMYKEKNETKMLCLPGVIWTLDVRKKMIKCKEKVLGLGPSGLASPWEVYEAMMQRWRRGESSSATKRRKFTSRRKRLKWVKTIHFLLSFFISLRSLSLSFPFSE